MDKTLMDRDLPGGGHLPPERLAALADESPSAAEAHHLASCAICTDEVAAYQALLNLTRGERDRLGEPLTSWAALSTALASEHLLETGSRIELPVRRRRQPAALRSAAQVAAAALFVASGIAIGRVTDRQPSPQPAATAKDGKTLAFATAVHAGIAPATRLVSDTTTFSSRGEALDALQQAEVRYRHAVAYLMESDSSALAEGPEGYRTRLAALEQVERTTRAALAAAPDDPVLNQWYISTVGAQQATIRQLVQARPLSQSPHRY